MRQRGSVQMQYKKAKKQKKKEGYIILSIVVVFILLVTIAGFFIFINRNVELEPNMNVVDFRAYHNLTNDIYIVFDNAVINHHSPQIINDEMHLPINFLNEIGFLGPHLYWEPDIELLTITTGTELIRISPNNDEMYLNYVNVPSNFIFRNIDGVAYFPISFIENRFDLQSNLTEANFLVVNKTNLDNQIANVIVEDAYIRYLPDNQSPIVQHLYFDEVLHILDMSNEFINEMLEAEENSEYEFNNYENYTLVRTNLGTIGFILTENLSYFSIIEGFTNQPERLPRLTANEPLNIAWDLVTNYAANNTAERRIVHPGVNIMAPKWLRFAGSEQLNNPNTLTGTLENISSRDYINWARQNGMQVWPLLFDYQNPQVATEVLSNTELRDYVINQLINIANDFDFDGIMIDIEGTNESNQEYFLQFLRELSPIMRENNLIYSIAVFVPAEWRTFYNHGEIGRVVDYVAVMAYDQNVASIANLLEDATAGPNASINFVRNAVIDLINVMDSRQIILGLPFYTRIWYITEVDGVNSYRQRNVGIQFGQNYFRDANVPLEWSDYYGSYFARFVTTMNDGTEEVTLAWIETERSLELKANLVFEFDLAGVAGWQRSLATNGVWQMLQRVLGT
ncbi:MAG: glycosyl hydrolase family 18 protein [Defluviitaleaceae bacterium]|nr:glycosyl hydrolase family 18 protein [Defluviitaleaceae bacterium]